MKVALHIPSKFDAHNISDCSVQPAAKDIGSPQVNFKALMTCIELEGFHKIDKLQADVGVV